MENGCVLKAWLLFQENKRCIRDLDLFYFLFLASAIMSSVIFLKLFLGDIAPCKILLNCSGVLDCCQSPLCCVVCWLKPKRFSCLITIGSTNKD